ncbi:hypothetical protein [Microbacterium sp. KNMS]
MTGQLPPPPEWVAQRALNLIGLRALDMSDPLHEDLARSIYELGPGASDGVVLQRIRWHFAWYLKQAGQEFAEAKLAYDHYVDRRTVELRAGEKPPSRAEAEQIARAEDDAYAAKLRYLLAEQRERAMRKLLDSVESAIDLFRTARADERKADAAHAHGYGGGL